MPKVKRLAKLELYDIIVKNIKFYASKNGNCNTITSISERVGIPKSTLSNKLANPKTLTLEDIYLISSGLKISYQELFNDNT